MPKTKQDYFDRFIRLVRIAGVCVGLVNIALGLYELITFAGGVNPRTVINALYSIIFGMLMIICEARWVKVLKHFYFLQLFLGLGAFYIFVGGLALGGDWYQYAVGAICIGIGLIYFLLGLACRRMGKENFKQSGLGGKSADGTPIPPTQPTPGALSPSSNNIPSSEGQPHGATPQSGYGGGSVYENSYKQDGGSYAEPAAIRAAKQNQSAYSHDPEMA